MNESPSPSEPTGFDYDLLDDVLPSLRGPNDPLVSSLTGCQVSAIGPLVEFALLAATNPMVFPPLADVSPSQPSTDLCAILACDWETQHDKTTSQDSRPWEFSRVPPKVSVSDPYWVAFVQRVRHAATAAGFDRDTARKLVGSFYELADNIWEHSDAPKTGLVGYRRVIGRFEFVIGDTGIGVVASLNKKPEFAHLTDAGTALEIALTLADTPYGRRTGRGSGYRNMLASLLDLSGHVRVRSGDHGLRMTGSELAFACATTFQAAQFQGFFQAVECRVGKIQTPA